MTIYYMGGEMGSLIPADASVVETALSFGYDSAFTRTATKHPYDTSYSETPDFGNLTTAWLHFDHFERGGVGADDYRMMWYDNSGVERVRFRYNNSTVPTVISMEYNVGAGWVTAGSTATITGGQLDTIDINVVCNSASGSIVLYLSGTERINSGVINLSAITELERIRFYGGTSTFGFSSETDVSQIIVADEPTIGWRILTRYMNGAGATSAWTGAYTDVDETVYSDADFILSGTANQVSTFTQTGPALTGYQVRAVAVTARAKKGASGPANIQLALRVSGTDYFSGSKALTAGYASYVYVWEQNPATAADWVDTAISAIQPGVKSIV